MWQLCSIVRYYAQITLRGSSPLIIQEMHLLADGVVLTVDQDGKTVLWYDRQAYKPIPNLKDDVICAHPGVHGVADLACNQKNRMNRAKRLIVKLNGDQVLWHNPTQDTS